MKKFLVLMCVLSLFLAAPAYSASISETGMRQGDLVRLLKSLKSVALNGALASAGMTSNFHTTQGATARTTYPIGYKVNGVLYGFPATSNMYLPIASAQAVSTYCRYLFTIDPSRIIKVTKGKDAASTDAAYYPAAPASGSIFGGALIKTSAASAFTMGSSSFTTSYLPFAPVWYNLNAVSNERGLATLP